MIDLDDTVIRNKIGYSYSIPAQRFSALSPDFQWLMTTVQMDEGDRLVVVLMKTDETRVLVPDLGDPDSPFAFSDTRGDWLNNTTIVLTGQDDDDSFLSAKYDVRAILADESTEVPATELAEFKGSPVPDPVHQNRFLHSCRDDSENINLCLRNVEKDADQIVVSGEFDMVNYLFSSEANRIVFEVDWDQNDDEDVRDDNMIGVHDLSTRETFFLVNGMDPVVSSAHPDIAGYLTYDVTGALQVAIVNIGR